jgi:hypothetical protein
VDTPFPAPDQLIRPWRRATIVASLIAAVELVVLLVAGFALLAKPLTHAMQRQAAVHAFEPREAKAAVPATPVVAAPKQSRFQTDVLVLNGSGRTGAASDTALRLRNFGYTITGTGNAPRTDYASTVVMFRPGYRGEAQRLARDMHLRVVGPLDGLKLKQLMGAQIALILGVG